MCGLCDAYLEEPEHKWWRYGEYVGRACPKCGRERLMQCEHVVEAQISIERIICEKCCWEPERNAYCYDALSDR